MGGTGIGTVGFILGGVFAGPFVLSILTVIYYGAFEPTAFADGQFVLVFVTAVPLGALLGALAGLCLSKWRGGERRKASKISVAGGIAMLSLSVAIAISSAETRGGGFHEFVETVRSGWIAPPAICAAGFVVSGIVSWRRLRGM